MPERVYDDYAFQSDGGEVIGVLPKHHKCTVGNGETFRDKVPTGTLYRCPCGQHWLKVQAGRSRDDRWVRVGGLRLWRLKRIVVPPEAAGSTR